MKESLKCKLNLELVAKGFGLSIEDTTKFLNDGRIIGRLGEFIYASNMEGSRTKSEGTSYDVDGKNGERLEVRSITKAISFASSKEVGYGRSVTEEGYSKKLDSLDSYIGIDFRNLSELNFIQITKDDLVDMNNLGILGKNKSVSSKKFYEYFKSKNV